MANESNDYVTTRVVVLRVSGAKVELASGEPLPKGVTSAQIELLRGQRAIEPAPVPTASAVADELETTGRRQRRKHESTASSELGKPNTSIFE